MTSRTTVARVRRTLGLSGAGALLAATALVGAGTPALAADQTFRIYTVDVNDFLYYFPSDSPQTTTDVGNITGLQSGEHVIGVDFRSTDGQLYGVTDRNRIYIINVDDATATLKSTLSTRINGTDIDIDFNSTVDLLRITTDHQQNLRVNVDTGAVTVDGALHYASGDTNAGKAPTITGAAYTNPDNDSSTGTELFDIDPGQTNTNDIVSKQNPPNDGTLTTRGSTGVNSAQLIGFDFAQGSIGYVGLVTGDGNILKKITFDNDPATNDAPTVTFIGTIGRTGTLRDFAVQQPTPPPGAVVPEFPVAALAPLLGFGALGLVVVRRRREGGITPTTI